MLKIRFKMHAIVQLIVQLDWKGLLKGNSALSMLRVFHQIEKLMKTGDGGQQLVKILKDLKKKGKKVMTLDDTLSLLQSSTNVY